MKENFSLIGYSQMSYMSSNLQTWMCVVSYILLFQNLVIHSYTAASHKLNNKTHLKFSLVHAISCMYVYIYIKEKVVNLVEKSVVNLESYRHS